MTKAEAKKDRTLQLIAVAATADHDAENFRTARLAFNDRCEELGVDFGQFKSLGQFLFIYECRAAHFDLPAPVREGGR